VRRCRATLESTSRLHSWSESTPAEAGIRCCPGRTGWSAHVRTSMTSRGGYCASTSCSPPSLPAAKIRFSCRSPGDWTSRIERDGSLARRSPVGTRLKLSRRLTDNLRRVRQSTWNFQSYPIFHDIRLSWGNVEQSHRPNQATGVELVQGLS